MATACAAAAAATQSQDAGLNKRTTCLELNAVSPRPAQSIGQVIRGTNMTFVDGGILGFPPRKYDDDSWFRPPVVISRPSLIVASQYLPQDPISVLNIRHISNEIGSASGLKMCFGAIYKGHATITSQAYTTARNLGILPALQDHLKELFPEVAERVESSMLGSLRKAYK